MQFCHELFIVVPHIENHEGKCDGLAHNSQFSNKLTMFELSPCRHAPLDVFFFVCVDYVCLFFANGAGLAN